MLTMHRNKNGLIFGAKIKFLGLALVVCMFSLVCYPKLSLATDDANQLPAPLVKEMTVRAEDIVLKMDSVGKTVGSITVQLKAQVGGIIKKHSFQEGELVKKDDVILEIDPDTYQANYDRANAKKNQMLAELDNASKEWNRVKMLYNQNAVSQRDRDRALTAFNTAKANFDASEAELKEASIKLDYAYVKAPISGYASKNLQQAGNLVTAGESILTEINQLDPIHVEFSISSLMILKMRQLVSKGIAKWQDKTVCKIRFTDGSLYDKNGEVNFVDSKVDLATSTLNARATFPNEDLLVLPGQFVRLEVTGPTLMNVIAIPKQAILNTQMGPMVIIIDDKNTVQSKIIKTLLNMGDRSIVAEGLKPGDRIVIEGMNKIKDGQTVRIAEAKTATETDSQNDSHNEAKTETQAEAKTGGAN